MKCKKLTLFILIASLFFIPFYVNAKESCTIVSGNGTDIGSEIACGTEHFYVIDSNDTSVRMLAKYNLLVGESINRITFSQERWDELVSKYYYDWYGSTYFYRSMLAEPEFDGEYGFSNNGMDAVDVDNRAIYTIKEWNMEYKKIVVSEERFNELQTQYRISSTGDDYSRDILNEPEFDGWFISYINPEYYTFGLHREINIPVKQDPTAIGAHGTTPGSPDFPMVGFIKSQYDLGFSVDAPKTDSYRGGYNNFEIDQERLKTEGNYYHNYLKDYAKTLDNYEIEEYSYLSIDGLDNIVYKLTNNHLPLEDWLTGWQTATGTFGNYNIMGSFKEYLPNGYEWLYSTTYWTMSGIGTGTTDRYEIFIDTLGNVCNDYYCEVAVGAGVRPVITIPKIEVPSYTITPVTDENGTIEVATESAGGESISFVLKAKAGYKLKNLVLKTASGTEVAFDNVTEDDSGNIIVYTSNFVMPNENVTLTATWEEIIYDIEKDTNDNGQIEVVPESAGGNEVLFVLKAKSGFKLKSIAILNENNEVVDYADLTEELEEGIYVYRSKFVMPNNGVTIKAVWEEIEEPVTPDEPEILEYEIKSNITGDGKIEVASKAKKGDEVTFKLTALNGSTLTKLVLKNSNGDEIEYTNISEDKDGNTIITMNKFTMPEGIVTIDATFEVVKVPITGDNLIRYIMILVGSLIILTFTKVAYKKNNKKKVLVVE
jgi:hypothetical protein